MRILRVGRFVVVVGDGFEGFEVVVMVGDVVLGGVVSMGSCRL